MLGNKPKSSEPSLTEGLQDYHFHRMVDILSDVALFGIDAAGNIISWNLGAKLLLGYEAREILGKPFHWLFPVDEGEESAAFELREARRLGRADDNRWHRRKDGSLMWAMGITEKLDENFFHPLAYVKVIRDHTEQKRLMDELEERASELEAVFQSIPDAVYIGSEAAIKLANRQALEMLGFDNIEQLRKNIGALSEEIQVRSLNGAPVPILEQAFARALTGTSLETEVIVRNIKTGQDLIVRSAAAPIRRGGEIVGAVAVNTDITNKKLIEGALRESEEKFRLLLDSTQEGICGVDSNLICTFVNQAAAKLLGYASKEDLLGKDFHRIALHPLGGDEPDGKSPCPLLKAVREGQAVRLDKQLMHKSDGKTLCADVRAYPFLGWNKDRKGAVIVFSDIEERLKTERILEKAQEHYFQAGKMEAIGRLAGGLAHEFNNMMTAVLGNTHLILSEGKLDGQSRECLEEIRIGAERAAELTRKLLAFGRGQMLINRFLDVNELIRRLEPILKQSLGGTIRLELVLNSEIPLIAADAAKMELALMELTLNAREAMPKGGAVTITTERVRKDEKSDRVRLVVSDTGRGMDEETVKKVFEPFFTTKGQVSSGMSLASIYGFVRQSGGEIQAKSKPGEGTRFEIDLPIAEGATEEIGSRQVD